MRESDNQLLVRRLSLTKKEAENKPATILSEWLSDDSFLYSYLVKCKVTDGEVQKYIIQVTVSQIDRYNTVPVPEAILGIVESLNSKSMEFVVGYQQPPLDIMVEAFTPLVHSLARRMAKQWNQEYDDMVQTCYLCMCTLYNKGYYLNKSLLTSTFVREVLTSLRRIYTATRNGYKGTISLSQTLHDESSMTIESMIEDEAQTEMFYKVEEDDEREYRIKVQREMTKAHLGERRYNSILASIESGTTNAYERSLMYKAGQKLRNKCKGD